MIYSLTTSFYKNKFIQWYELFKEFDFLYIENLNHEDGDFKNIYFDKFLNTDKFLSIKSGIQENSILIADGEYFITEDTNLIRNNIEFALETFSKIVIISKTPTINEKYNMNNVVIHSPNHFSDYTGLLETILNYYLLDSVYNKKNIEECTYYKTCASFNKNFDFITKNLNINNFIKSNKIKERLCEYSTHDNLNIDRVWVEVVVDSEVDKDSEYSFLDNNVLSPFLNYRVPLFFSYNNLTNILKNHGFDIFEDIFNYPHVFDTNENKLNNFQDNLSIILNDNKIKDIYQSTNFHHRLKSNYDNLKHFSKKQIQSFLKDFVQDGKHHWIAVI